MTTGRVFPGSIAFAASINHLLAQESWARDKLAPNSGKVACLASEMAAVHLRATADGLVEAVGDLVDVNVTIRIKLIDGPLVLQNPERAFSYVKLEGDADFANIIMQLGQSLRWEPEQDLQPLVGDIAATRVVAGAKAVLEGVKQGQQRLAENLAEYFLEENPMLVRPATIGQFGDAVAETRDDVERLAKRIEKLALKVQTKPMQEKPMQPKPGIR
jgi:ubiquinone biosynthesis protein UbiJ